MTTTTTTTTNATTINHYYLLVPALVPELALVLMCLYLLLLYDAAFTLIVSYRNPEFKIQRTVMPTIVCVLNP